MHIMYCVAGSIVRHDTIVGHEVITQAANFVWYYISKVYALVSFESGLMV